jgi:diguanylate cyclase (GGDEF)-like protein
MLLNQAKRTFLVVTFVIFLFDVMMVCVNYQSSREALQTSLESIGEQFKDSYEVTLDQVGTFMQQTATYIAHDDRINQLFLSGKKAVEEEGGGPGGRKAAQRRAELFDLVSDSWDEMTKTYKGRQLHFHLPPDISFLRVHRPEKFGDDLSSIRHSVVAVNENLIQTKGFESGRVYAGIRGVVPVFAFDPDSNQEVHVGALEAGMSYNLMLDQLKDSLDSDFAVLMTIEHAQETMWPSFLEEYLITHPVVQGHLLEASTNMAEANLLMEIEHAQQLLGQYGTVLIDLADRPFKLTAFPLRDYLGSVDTNHADIGTVLVWADASEEVAGFHRGYWKSIAVAIIGFILIELLILWGFRTHEHSEENERKALKDPMTGLSNRRAFDEALSQQVEQARRHHESIGIVMIDVDNFKLYNDTYGHIGGDDCLNAIARALAKQVKRSSDVLARFGGEEFVLMVSNTSAEQLKEYAESLRVAVQELSIEHQDNDGIGIVTISCGIFVKEIREEADSTDVGVFILEQADKALYKAKENGRNRVEVIS